MCKCSYERSGCCTLRPTLTRCSTACDWHQAFLDERDRYDRLVSFELDEAAELAKFKADTHNVVIVYFPEMETLQLYSVPERINLRKGRKVILANTDDIGTVYHDSFHINSEALNALAELQNITLPLEPVVGMRFGDE